MILYILVSKRKQRINHNQIGESVSYITLYKPVELEIDGEIKDYRTIPDHTRSTGGYVPRVEKEFDEVVGCEINFDKKFCGAGVDYEKGSFDGDGDIFNPRIDNDMFWSSVGEDELLIVKRKLKSYYSALDLIIDDSWMINGQCVQIKGQLDKYYNAVYNGEGTGSDVVILQRYDYHLNQLISTPVHHTTRIEVSSK